MKKLWLKFWNGLRVWGFKRWGGLDFTVEGMTSHGFKSSFVKWKEVELIEWTTDLYVCTVWINGNRYELLEEDVEQETWEDLKLLYKPY